MNNIVYRLFYLFIGWSTVGLIYEANSYLHAKATILHPSKLDDLIPFTPNAIWLYLSFFLIIPLAFLCAPLPRTRWMSLSFIGTSMVAGMIYFIFPTSMVFPEYHDLSVSERLLDGLISIDTQNNCLPSLHVALTTLVVWGYINAQRVFTSLLFIVWGLAICLSVLFLKRHLFLDVVTGAALAILVGNFVEYGLGYFHNLVQLKQKKGQK